MEHLPPNLDSAAVQNPLRPHRNIEPIYEVEFPLFAKGLLLLTGTYP
jgi:hypothetical protein